MTRKVFLDQKQIEKWATTLHEARKTRRPLPQLSQQMGEAKASFTEASAYSIQALQRRLREKDGEKVIGYKMGLTSEAKRKQMNLHSPLYGILTDRMQVANEGFFPLTGSIHPKIEPEIAFLISKDLRGRVTREEVLNSCGGIAAALEILDSRYEQFKYFSLEDVISDNSSSSHFVLGPWKKDFSQVDLIHLSMTMSVNETVAQTGISKDISDDPVISVIQLCELLAKSDLHLPAGSIVLAGAATAAEALKPGMKISLTVDQLPSVSVSVREEAAR